MEGLIFPIIMLAITLVGGGILLLVVKNTKPKKQIDEEMQSIKTAQEFINVKNINDKFLYTNDGLCLVFLRIQGVSIDLYSKAEKNSLIRQLTTELSDIGYPFKFMALSRPVDISPLIHELTEEIKTAEDKRKELLRHEIYQMNGFALSGDIVERQFYISIWDKTDHDNDKDLLKRANLLVEKFTANGVGADIITEKEIVRLLNLVNNPSYTHLEDTDYNATIPMIGGVEQ